MCNFLHDRFQEWKISFDEECWNRPGRAFSKEKNKILNDREKQQNAAKKEFHESRNKYYGSEEGRIKYNK